MNKKKTNMRLFKTEHIRCHLWQIYSVAIYKVKMATVTSIFFSNEMPNVCYMRKGVKWRQLPMFFLFIWGTQVWCRVVQFRAVWSTLVQTCASYKIDIQSMIANRMLDKIIKNYFEW